MWTHDFSEKIPSERDPTILFHSETIYKELGTFRWKWTEILLVVIKTPHKLYPFQNQSFDEVVDSYLPVLNQLDIKNKENFHLFEIKGLHTTVPGPWVSDNNVCKNENCKGERVIQRNIFSTATNES